MTPPTDEARANRKLLSTIRQSETSMMRAKADRLCHHGEDIQTCDGLHFSEEILEVLGGKTVTITEAQLRDAMEHHSYHPTVGSYRDEHCGANSCAGAVFERLMK